MIYGMEVFQLSIRSIVCVLLLLVIVLDRYFPEKKSDEDDKKELLVPRIFKLKKNSLQEATTNDTKGIPTSKVVKNKIKPSRLPNANENKGTTKTDVKNQSTLTQKSIQLSCGFRKDIVSTLNLTYSENTDSSSQSSLQVASSSLERALSQWPQLVSVLPVLGDIGGKIAGGFVASAIMSTSYGDIDLWVPHGRGKRLADALLQAGAINGGEFSLRFGEGVDAKEASDFNSISSSPSISIIRRS